VGLGRLKELASPGWCTGWAGWQAQMGKNLGNHGGIFKGGDERQGATTV